MKQKIKIYPAVEGGIVYLEIRLAENGHLIDLVELSNEEAAELQSEMTLAMDRLGKGESLPAAWQVWARPDKQTGEQSHG